MVPPSDPTSLRILVLAIEHLPRYDEDHYDPRRIGRLGERSFAARLGDDVTVRAELSEAAYAYLIAFRPDGVVELCYPEDETTPPPPTTHPQYPPPGTDEVYRLSDGTGLQAFALVISREPLPPFQAWKHHLDSAPWRPGLPGTPGVVWRHDGQDLRPLTAAHRTGQRGKGARTRGGGDAVAELATWLRSRPGVDAIAFEAFPVVERGS